MPDFKLTPLYAWYRKHQRELPFRGSVDPYAIWVSEVMLQQTRVAAMLPRYAAFIQRFPTLDSLAVSTESDVLKAWQGLGYYSRARNLRRAAQEIKREHQGVFPSEQKILISLPGIGDYTSAAILSICFEQEIPVLDGNVKRVLHRLFMSECEKAANVSVLLKELAHRLIRGVNRPSHHNQALMELGALVCVPGTPSCHECPLRNVCQAFLSGGPALAGKFPPRKVEQKLDLLIDYFALRTTRGYWICRDPSARFLANQWMFPSALDYPGRPRMFTPGLGAFVSPARQNSAISQGPVRHTITHHRIVAKLKQVECVSPRRIPSTDVQWRTVSRKTLSAELVSSLGQKLIRLLPP